MFKRLIFRLLSVAFKLLVSIPVVAQLPVGKSGDPGMEIPRINLNPLPLYGYDRLDYGMTISIERTKGGRIWSCWVAGGDNEDAFFVLNTSDDNGKTWSNPRIVIDPHDTSLPFKRRTIVGALWLDPGGKLWLFFDQAMTYFDGRAGNWYTTCSNPDDQNPVWSQPRYVGYGCTLNKPIVLSNGHWLLPVSLWDRGKIREPYFANAYHELDSLRKANLFISKDKGKTWNHLGGVAFPNPQFDEHHIIERRDSSLWMTARTANGIFQSSSYDGGITWSTPEKYLPHIGSRHFIRRLSSGHLLLVKHGELNETTKFRSKLMAFVSDDDGKTWKGGLMLDERRGISYPDGFQAPDGTIFISYDRNRETDGEILMVHFTEKDVLNGHQKGKSSPEHRLISRPLGRDKLPAPCTLAK
ncbi:MAG TPA: sialidase family protein [Flavisolibacter sp.]|nr:sialidase family protein [Flavisolibacter sp.]